LITIEADQFEVHLKEGLRMWQEGGYSPSIEPSAFSERQKREVEEVEKERRKVTAARLPPSCW
jgi:hypothetical protein